MGSKEVKKDYMNKIQSTCNICSIGCNMDFYVENNKITKVSPTKDYTVNKGLCCIKGLFNI